MSLNNVRAVGDDRPWKDEVERELGSIWDSLRYGRITLRAVSGSTGGGGGGSTGPGLDSISAVLPATYDTVTYEIGVDQDAFDHISSLDYAQFDTTTASAGDIGRLMWNDTDGTLEFGLKGGLVTLQIGQEQVVRVRNNTGGTLTEGTVCYFSSSNGTNFNVTPAIASSDATSAQTMGVLTETLNTSSTQHGFLTTFGMVRGIDLSYIAGLADGDQLYLDGTTAGRMTKTKPVAPIHLVYVGICLSAAGSGSNSTIFVKIQNGYELDEIHDVKITAPVADNEVLAYTLATDLWENKTAAESGLATAASPTFTGTVTTPLITAGYVTTTSGGVLGSVATIPNVGLTNSSVTVNGTSIALGASGTVTAAPSGSAGGKLSGTYPDPGLNAALDDLSDVVITTPATDQVIKYNGTNWVNAASPGGGGGTVTSITAGTGLSASPSSPITTSGTLSLNAALDDLTDVTISAPDKGEGLIFDGTSWVNSTQQSYNYLINGAFDFWQRGTSSTASAVYLADRWYHNRAAGTSTVSQSTDVPAGYIAKYSLSFASTSGTNPGIYQYIESSNALQFAGKKVTISIWAKSTVGTGGLSWQSSYPTTVDDWTTPISDNSGVFAASMTVGTWTRYTASFTTNALATRGYRFRIYRDVTTTSTTTLYTGAQLELGGIATPFRRNAASIQGELDACLRYYENYNSTTGAVFPTGTHSTSTARFMGAYTVQKRVNPAISISGGADTLRVSENGTDSQLNSSVCTVTGTNQKTFAVEYTGTFALGTVSYVYMGSSATALIQIDAELS